MFGPDRVVVAWWGDEGLLGDHPRQPAPVDRQHAVLACFGVPGADQRDQPVAVLLGEVVVLRRVLRDVVELPAGGVELGQLLCADRLAETDSGLGERRARPGADCSPAVVVDGSMAEHLEVLRVVLAGGVRVLEGMREADAVHRCLGDAADGGWGLDVEQVEHGGHHVDDVGVLRPDLAARPHPGRPGHDERVARAAAVGLALPAAERCVAGPGPAPRVVVEVVRAADLVDDG